MNCPGTACYHVPEPIGPLLQHFLHSLEQRLPGLVEGVYLHGSIALGAFDERLSDIDFLAVLSHRCTPQDVATLQLIHKELERIYPEWDLEGSYLQHAELGRPVDEVEPHPVYHDRLFTPNGHFDLNPVTWWLLKHRAIVLRGSHPRKLDFHIEWASVRDYMLENLNSYWAAFTMQPDRMAWLLADEGVQWAVLGVLRQYYTLREGDITSKLGAGEYALASVPARWHRIIREAMNVRAVPGAGSLYRSRVARAIESWRFLKYLIQSCNAPAAGS